MPVIGAGYCEGCRAVYPVLSGEALLCRCPSCRSELVDAPAELTGFEEQSWAASSYPSREARPTEAGDPNRHQLSLIARPSVIVEYDPDAYGIEDGSVRRGLFIAHPAHQPRHLAGLGLSEVGALQALAWELRAYALRHAPSSALLRADQLLHAARRLSIDGLRDYLHSVAGPAELLDRYGLVLREASAGASTRPG